MLNVTYTYPCRPWIIRQPHFNLPRPHFHPYHKRRTTLTPSRTKIETNALFRVVVCAQIQQGQVQIPELKSG